MPLLPRGAARPTTTVTQRSVVRSSRSATWTLLEDAGPEMTVTPLLVTAEP